MSVIIETSIGDFTVDLYTDERPRCCLNFLKLCKIKYYNFSLFHSVQSNLVAQTGDPTATGRGGESIYARLYGEQARFFDMEVSPRIKHVKKGLISMVNNGSGMHGSQFFITLAESLDYLDGKHTVFGEVAEGFDILDKLNDTFCGEDNRPHQDIRIYHTIILDDPYDDPDGLVIPAMSPGPTEEMLNSDHIPCDANIDEDKGKTEAELAEVEAEKEAKANTQILEMVGDLPSADVAPPENVLFVCKLNPVTTSEDLEIIFSRFGKIVNCDVIKDSKTGESLQYAFIEFDNPDSCESAYFKMDNVLIDDRRIHVDFSQSVSKLKWKGKGKGVDVLASGDAPVYVLKNQQRRDNNYDLVYDDDVPAVESSKKNRNKQDSRDRRNKSPSKDRANIDRERTRNEPSRGTREESGKYRDGQQREGGGREQRENSRRDRDNRDDRGSRERDRERRRDDSRKDRRRGRDYDEEISRAKKLSGDSRSHREERKRRYSPDEDRHVKRKRDKSAENFRGREDRDESDNDRDRNVKPSRKESYDIQSKKDKRKQDRDSSSEASDSSVKEGRKEKKKKKKRKHDNSSDDAKKQKIKKSKKQKRQDSSDSERDSHKVKKKKKSKHRQNRSDSD